MGAARTVQMTSCEQSPSVNSATNQAHSCPSSVKANAVRHPSAAWRLLSSQTRQTFRLATVATAAGRSSKHTRDITPLRRPLTAKQPGVEQPGVEPWQKQMQTKLAHRSSQIQAAACTRDTTPRMRECKKPQTTQEKRATTGQAIGQHNARANGAQTQRRGLPRRRQKARNNRSNRALAKKRERIHTPTDLLTRGSSQISTAEPRRPDPLKPSTLEA